MSCFVSAHPAQFVTVGGTGRARLARQLREPRCCADDSVLSRIRWRGFRFSRRQRKILLIFICPYLLGFTKAPTISSILTKEFCEQWNLQNSSEDFSIELCKPEDAIALRLQTKKSPDGRGCKIAMIPINDVRRTTRFEPTPSIFYLGENGKRRWSRWIIMSAAYSDSTIGLYDDLVFRCRMKNS